MTRPLSTNQIRTILDGLPDPPAAIGINEVIALIHSVRTSPQPSERLILGWLIQQGWVTVATEFPRNKDGEFHFYRRTKEGREALNGSLMTRKSQWV